MRRPWVPRREGRRMERMYPPPDSVSERVQWALLAGSWAEPRPKTVLLKFNLRRSSLLTADFSLFLSWKMGYGTPKSKKSRGTGTPRTVNYACASKVTSWYLMTLSPQEPGWGAFWSYLHFDVNCYSSSLICRHVAGRLSFSCSLSFIVRYYYYKIKKKN